jgi:hypothetical protein
MPFGRPCVRSRFIPQEHYPERPVVIGAGKSLAAAATLPRPAGTPASGEVRLVEFVGELHP